MKVSLNLVFMDKWTPHLLLILNYFFSKNKKKKVIKLYTVDFSKIYLTSIFITLYDTTLNRGTNVIIRLLHKKNSYTITITIYNVLYYHNNFIGSYIIIINKF